MKHQIRFFRLLNYFVSCLLVLLFFSCTPDKEQAKVLIFTPPAETGKDYLPELAAIMKLTAAQHIIIQVSEQASLLSDNLDQYNAVIFLGDFGSGLSREQQRGLEEYVGSGGGFMGLHAELENPGAWPWYDGMYQSAGKRNVIQVARDKQQPSAASFLNQQYGGGRISLMEQASSPQQYQQAEFQDQFLSGLGYVLGTSGLENGAGAAANADERFNRRVLQKDVKDGVKLTIADNGIIYYIERDGKLYKLDPAAEAGSGSSMVGQVPVSTVSGNGLLGIALDPGFANNNLIYLYYTPRQAKTLHQKLSRFQLKDGGLDLASEKVLLTVPYNFREDGHTGGAMLFDDQGNLFLSTGDNTHPHEANGFGPLDDRPGRSIFDAQRTAGNTASLLGKILRIKPQPDGSYTIPEGNLFPANSGKDRPEIYVMGCRNPYSMSFDSRTGFLYWGEVGPDAGRDSTRGSRGYDEINQVRQAGYYGWPYFIGENKAYAAYDFKTQKIGDFFDPAAPVNNSINNTGSKLLPPAQPAFISYPYTKSDKFPQLGEGTRCAIAGPVYHYDPELKSAVKFPAQYDNVLFIADWSRKWLMTVYLDEEGNYARSEPFMPLTTFDRPLDLKFGPDGALYLLEYGEPWGVFKTYGSLVRIEYNNGNRPPLAVASASDTIGAGPLTVKFSASGSIDYDGDAVKMQWTIGGQALGSQEANPQYTFRHPGQYLAMLTVTDAHGQSSQDWVTIQVGNARPSLRMETQANQTFYWDDMVFDYQVKVQDAEDGAGDPARLQVSLDYLPEGKDVAGLFIGSQDMEKLRAGNGSVLMAKSDCSTCHTPDKPALGPALQQIARRYSDENATVEKLARKVINGGGGVWGNFPMSAHPQLSPKDARAIVRYILSLDNQAAASASLPAQGRLMLNKHQGRGNEGLYILTASYTDKGGKKIGPLAAARQIRLRNPRVDAASSDTFKGITKTLGPQGEAQVSPAGPGDYISFKDIDLRHVDHLTYRLAPGAHTGFIEVRVGSASGPVISRLDLQPAAGEQDKISLSAPIRDPGGKNELFFVFGGNRKAKEQALRLQWISFDLKKQLAKAGAASGRSRS